MTALLIHDSHTTHGALSEPHMRTPDRKGREGKGRESEGKGARVETPIHSSGYVTAGSRLGWMGETR